MLLMRILRAVPNFDYFRYHKVCFALSIAFCLITVGSLMTRGLNFGVDFAGGIVVEVRTQGPADLADMRAKGVTVAEPSDPFHDEDFIRALTSTYTIAPTQDWIERPAGVRHSG